jgi:hypothetical protein
MHYNNIKYVGKLTDLKGMGYTFSDWSIMNWTKSVGVRDENFRIYKRKGWMSISEFTNFEGYLLLFLINLRATSGTLTKIKGYTEPEVSYVSLFINRRTGEISEDRAHRERQMVALEEAKKYNPNGDHRNIFVWMDYFIRWEILEEVLMMYDKGLIIPVIERETHNFG